MKKKQGEFNQKTQEGREKQRAEMLAMHAEGKNYTQIGKHFNCHPTNVSTIIKRAKMKEAGL